MPRASGAASVKCAAIGHSLPLLLHTRPVATVRSSFPWTHHKQRRVTCRQGGTGEATRQEEELRQTRHSYSSSSTQRRAQLTRCDAAQIGYVQQAQCVERHACGGPCAALADVAALWQFGRLREALRTRLGCLQRSRRSTPWVRIPQPTRASRLCCQLDSLSITDKRRAESARIRCVHPHASESQRSERRAPRRCRAHRGHQTVCAPRSLVSSLTLSGRSTRTACPSLWNAQSVGVCGRCVRGCRTKGAPLLRGSCHRELSVSTVLSLARHTTATCRTLTRRVRAQPQAPSRAAAR